MCSLDSESRDCCFIYLPCHNGARQGGHENIGTSFCLFELFSAGTIGTIELNVLLVRRDFLLAPGNRVVLNDMVKQQLY